MSLLLILLHNHTSVISVFTAIIVQGVVTSYYIIPAVLTPATGIKVRSSGQAVKLEMIKLSKMSSPLHKTCLKGGSGDETITGQRLVTF